MLYLAEVQRRPTGFGLGGGKTDLKLLACQRGEHNWVAVPAEEVIPSDEAKEFSPGALVLVDLNGSKQVQQIQDAARQLVKILQNFSRSQEKSKTQWEEIEQWKASLTFQAQEMNRREMELQAKEEQLEELQGEIDKLEEQRQEIGQAQGESQQVQEQIQREREEIEMARAELQRQQQELAENSGQFAQGAVLDAEQSQYIQDLLNWLFEAIAPTSTLGEKVYQSLEIINTQQTTLDQQKQEWDEKQDSTQQQEEVEGLANHIQNQWLEWRQDQESLAQARSELTAQQTLLASKQEYSQLLATQVETQTQLYQQLSDLVTASEGGGVSQKVDVELLENMPINELEELVQGLQQDSEKAVIFVKEMEEELNLQRQEMDALQTRIDQASEYDRITLESEFSDQQDHYRMLNKSLLGSQKNLGEREEILSVHQEVLRSRSGNSSSQQQPSEVALRPLISQVDSQRQKLTEELQRLEGEIQQIQVEINQKEETVNSQIQQQEAKRNEIEQLEQNLRVQQKEFAGVGSEVNTYQEIIQPLHGYVEQLQAQLQEVADGISQIQGIGEQFAQLQQVIQGIIGQPE
ncbi:MAG: pilus motility taxis protein HmpF [Microcoleaceae cyanobacterium MO_207.B10]|nr:pilus motility taxis protein HmpF [Microcoleaceae cyanobacterium MO_207.B10]